ncbi:hypothetical protein CcaverHIS002_0201910 [Cutaneotrichosporon cavernicola]|nr:hypothetical protein CcaverHIS002_0201910 [Cutaneotrichosporon cavernicola]BEI96607.1 hypothetical protein CcaverHIS631_0201960 [Cutaneotrichosporon cavernicola]
MFGGGHTVSPFSNLRGYLAHSSIEKFERWPESGQRQSFGRSDWGPSGREFTRRLNLAEAQRNRRQLRGWARDDYFKDMVVDDVEVHVPDTLLAKDDRRGEERFTVPATNFHTKRFRETSSVLPCDQYLLQWLNGTVLTSALSAVHAIRFHYTDATFMYAPSAVRRKGHKEKNYQGFPDGYGSLILVRDEANGGPALGPIDRRALLVSVVPPSPYTKEVLSAFTRTQEHWKQYSRSDNTSGLANLLQAQMYDECVAHGVRYWVATTLKWWVFGVFNKDLTQCVVSSKIRRSETACTVLECLVTWMRRALEAEEEAYCLAEQKEEWRDGNAFAPYNNRPALQRIPRKTTESRETSSTRTAPTESRQGKPTRKQTVPRTVPQLAEQRVRQRSTSFTRSQGRSKTELNQDGHTPTNPDSELESSQQKQDRRRERERVREGNARAQHTHVERYTYVRPVPVQFVHGFAPHAPAYFYQQRWF